MLRVVKGWPEAVRFKYGGKWEEVVIDPSRGCYAIRICYRVGEIVQIEYDCLADCRPVAEATEKGELGE